jgi:hypothetical protein
LVEDKEINQKWKKNKARKNTCQIFNDVVASSSTGNLKFGVKCFNCNEKGHIVKDFPKKKP